MSHIFTLLLILIGLIFGFGIYYYNQFVRKAQLLKEAFSGMDVQLKRRRDLIPNLVEVTKGYAKYESKVLEDVIRLRSGADVAKSLPDKASAENFLTGGLKSIFALVENYPDLKADQQFLHLQEQLVQIEHDLQFARRYYNGTVRDYNVLVQAFPGNLIANFFKYKVEDFFEIDVVTDRMNPGV